MSASCSKPSVSRASPPLSEPRSPPAASVVAEETRDDARGSSGVLACIPPSEAAGPLRKRLRSALLEDGGSAKRIKDVGNGVVPDTALLNDDGQFQLASAESGSLLFSCQPSRAATDIVLGPSGSAHGVQPMSSFELDRAKHKIFLSHAGAQKDFVEQLCVDLEHRGYAFPFFDQRHHSLPKGKDFAPLILEAARLCHVAVIVLSEEFLCSKWPMLELAEFYVAQQGARGGKLQFLPLFFKLSIEEVKDEDRWMPKWKEHAACDSRIDLSKWSAVVKALCKSNGENFLKVQWSAAMKALCESNGVKLEKVGISEVSYRKRVVESIFKLSPPDLLFGSSESMVGSSRMCEAMSSQFVEDPIVGARLLGIYGIAGLGKTMLAKALHDYFSREFLGKVCYVDMGRGRRAKRQKRMLKTFCGFEKDVLDWIGDDVEKGLMQMKTNVERERVFLVLDNITHSAHLVQEVQDYLRVKFHPGSRILITSSSQAILEDLLPNMKWHMPMPTLMVEEARELFMKRAAPMKAISALTSEEQKILGICVQKCWFPSPEGGLYHPVALTALADFFSRLGKAKGNQLLVWKDHLENTMDLVKDIFKSSKDLFGILALQFSTFDFSEKLLFLDLALYLKDFEPLEDLTDIDTLGWLCRVHDESPTIIRGKLLDLRKSGMINFSLEEYDKGWIQVPPLYEEFAQWYATDHKVNGLKTAWGVFDPGGLNLRGDFLTPIKSWSNLIRLVISPMTPANSRLVASKRMQELRNLVVLQLSFCEDLTTLNLEGLDCLRDLSLVYLPKLVRVTLCGNSSEDEYRGIYDSLQHVGLARLDSLVHMPDLRPCTSLHALALEDCPKVINLEGAECPYVKGLRLSDVYPHISKRLVDFKSYKSLEALWITVESDVDGFTTKWIPMGDDGGIGIRKVEGPCAKFFEELSLFLYGSIKFKCESGSYWKC